MTRYLSALTVAGLISSSTFAQGARHPADSPTPGAQIQRLQEQRLRASSETAVPELLEPSGALASTPDLHHLPRETPCFTIRRLTVAADGFGWLKELLQPVPGQCIGKRSLKLIQDVANNALIERGYITSRLLVPTQSLENGTLALQLVAGHISDIRIDGQSPGWLRSALPTHAGALLNQRNIDQGLENIRRLTSQSDATIDITSGAEPGDSVLIVHPGSGKRWHAVVGLDNAGARSTGQYQLSTALTIDAPFHLYDQLHLSANSNADRGISDYSNRSQAVNYSVPLGYAMLLLGASRSKYKQTVAGFQEPIVYSGVQTQLDAKLSAVIFRNAHARTEAFAKLSHKINHNAIDDTEIDVQHRNLLDYELGIAHRQYLGNAVLDATLGWRAGLPGVSSAPGLVMGDAEFNGKTQIETASASLLAPFVVGQQNLSYQLGWNAQNARTRLTPQDYFTIGNRYAVRGYDQQLTLAAESGWVVSNELDWLIPTAVGQQALYAGVDVGRVRGPSAEYLVGQTLAGAVVGARGSVGAKSFAGVAFTYDLSLGWPLSKPEGFQTGSPSVLFQVNALW
ncbi:MAG: ShlB/FhaC/HecB family hemolysin secretion/activation protein [Janthinobacterium lividum]